ncbi:MAG: ABC transporter ATP-binding protein [Desertifilum sp. SIO1I2]|nr:ABC transporter ATP-binding protein [Desertifilum sp. SIO1I2]
MSQTALSNQSTGVEDYELDVELRKVFKVFNGETAVRGVDLKIRQGEFFSILGPSGCGKTTTLRLVAGFEQPSAGEVIVRNQLVNHIPPYRRPVNTVFQSYALFNHMNVWDNIAFGLRIKKLTNAQIEDRVRDVLQLVKMEGFASRYPAQMSGGQQQRVALARALVNRPSVLLLDEPLGALDLKLRKEMQVELSNLHQELGLTFVMVTHDQEEALSLSQRIAVMREGKIEQIGTPTEIYNAPRTPFVADFIGDTNLFRGRIFPFERSTIQVTTDKGLTIFAQCGDLKNGKASDAFSNLRERVVVSIRPEKIQVSLEEPDNYPNCFEGRMKHVMFMGTHVQCVVELVSGDRLLVSQPNRPEVLVDSQTPLYAFWDARDCLALEE